MMAGKKDDLFDDDNVVSSNWIKWGKVGDFVAGTLIDVREMESNLPDRKGEMVKVYEILADDGEYHDLDDKKQPVDPPVKLEAGFVILVGGRQGIDAQMRRMKIGQKLGMKFTDEKPVKQKGYNALKIIKVFTTGEMNNEWLEQQEPLAKDLS